MSVLDLGIFIHSFTFIDSKEPLESSIYLPFALLLADTHSHGFCLRAEEMVLIHAKNVTGNHVDKRY